MPGLSVLPVASHLFVAYLPATIVLSIFAWLVKNHFTTGLNQIPGPYLASVTDWWRLYNVLVGRRQDVVQNRLHEQYGDIVRYGPNMVSFADPNAIKDIYGIGKPLTKVIIAFKSQRTTCQG